MLFDTHAHIYKEYYENIDEVIEDANNSGVGYIAIPGTSIEDSKEAIKTAEKYENVYALIGIHPENADKYLNDENIDKDLKEIEKLAENKKVIGIGEIGLDYYWTKEYIDIQKKLLVKQIELANKLKLPVILHIREATNDILEILQKNPPKYSGIFHSTSFNEHLIKEGLKLGFYISFSGTVTFKNAKPNSSVLLVPDDKLLIETDSPYLTPHPFRGKTNFPKYVKLTAEKIAEIKEKDFAYIEKITTENAKKLFKL